MSRLKERTDNTYPWLGDVAEIKQYEFEAIKKQASIHTHDGLSITYYDASGEMMCYAFKTTKYGLLYYKTIQTKLTFTDALKEAVK